MKNSFRRLSSHSIALFLMSLSPALAWEFTPDPICTVSNTNELGALILTFDPSSGDYAIAVTLDAGWDEASSFGMQFLGSRTIQIGTDRHVLADGGRTLTVTDRGFGNVLDGLEFNAITRASSGDSELVMSLSDAAPAMRAIRECPATPLS